MKQTPQPGSSQEYSATPSQSIKSSRAAARRETGTRWCYCIVICVLTLLITSASGYYMQDLLYQRLEQLELGSVIGFYVLLFLSDPLSFAFSLIFGSEKAMLLMTQHPVATVLADYVATMIWLMVVARSSLNAMPFTRVLFARRDTWYGEQRVSFIRVNIFYLVLSAIMVLAIFILP